MKQIRANSNAGWGNNVKHKVTKAWIGTNRHPWDVGWKACVVFAVAGALIGGNGGLCGGGVAEESTGGAAQLSQRDGRYVGCCQVGCCVVLIVKVERAPVCPKRGSGGRMGD